MPDELSLGLRQAAIHGVNGWKQSAHKDGT
jgi:hypothetical protein